MRLLLCLNDDFLSNYALNLLWPRLRGHEVHITLSRHIGSPATPRAEAIREWVRFEQKAVREQLFHQRAALPDAEGAPFATFPQLAARGGGALSSFDNINGPEALAFVRSLAPDVMLALRYGQIFKPPLLAIPRLGTLNLHGGLLPEYRGILANFWAMKHHEEQIGCTLHWVRDAGIDTGGIIATHRLRADYTRSVMWNIAAIYPSASALMADALNRLACGETLAEEEQQGTPGYYSYPQDDDVEALPCPLFLPSDYEEWFERYGLHRHAEETA